MIGVSIPELCFDPFDRTLERIAKDFGLWEVVSEADHDVSQVWQEMKSSRGVTFQVHAPFSDLNIGSLNKKVRDNSISYLKGTIRDSAKGGAKLVTLHPGIVSPMGSYDRERVVVQCIESLAELRDFAAAKRITLAIENMPRGGWALMWKASEAKRICEATGLGLCFDLGHAHLSGQTEEFLALSELFANVHVHDNDRSRDQHLTVGDGGADFAGLRKALEHYDGHVVVEGRSLRSSIESKKRLLKLGF